MIGNRHPSLTVRGGNPQLGLIGAVLCSIVAYQSIRMVPPAHVGVVNVLGNVRSDVLQAGIHLVNPFAEVVTISYQTKLIATQNAVPTSEGLNVELEVALLYHVDGTKARDIYLGIGVNFETVVVLSQLRSEVRHLTSEASAKALYTSGREILRDKLFRELENKLGPRGIIVEDVLLKSIKLPDQLTHAIELKLQTEQESQRMEFVLVKERQEAERKAVEAKGLAEFQKIVSEGISPELLRWKGIEATLKLADSQNAKIVMMGGGRDGLPLIMNDDGSMSPILNPTAHHIGKQVPTVVPTAAAHAQADMTTELEEKAAVTTSGAGVLTTKSVSAPSQ